MFFYVTHNYVSQSMAHLHKYLINVYIRLMPDCLSIRLPIAFDRMAARE